MDAGIPTPTTSLTPFDASFSDAAEPRSVEAPRFELEQNATRDDAGPAADDVTPAGLLELECRHHDRRETRSMSTFRVYVIAENSDDVTVGSWFTIEADDDVDAANEAITAARDCGWTNTHTTRVVLVDFRGDRDEHSGSRRLDVLEQQAPHLIAPDVLLEELEQPE